MPSITIIIAKETSSFRTEEVCNAYAVRRVRPALQRNITGDALIIKCQNKDVCSTKLEVCEDFYFQLQPSF